MSAEASVTIRCDYKGCDQSITIDEEGIGDNPDSIDGARAEARYKYGWQVVYYDMENQRTWDSPDDDLCPTHKAMVEAKDAEDGDDEGEEDEDEPEPVSEFQLSLFESEEDE